MHLHIHIVVVLDFFGFNGGRHDHIPRSHFTHVFIVFFTVFWFKTLVHRQFVRIIFHFFLDLENPIFCQIWHVVVSFEAFYYLVVE